MGSANGGNFGNTKGQKAWYKQKIRSLPKKTSSLLKQGWQDTTPKAMKENTSSKMFTDKESGLTIRFDKGDQFSKGFRGKDHYHVHNPNSTSKNDYYLDINGNPVPKNSKASHIIP